MLNGRSGTGDDGVVVVVVEMLTGCGVVAGAVAMAAAMVASMVAGARVVVVVVAVWPV